MGIPNKSYLTCIKVILSNNKNVPKIVKIGHYMTTVDNLNLDTSIQYAKNLEQFDAKIIEEAPIASRVQAAVIDPAFVSNLSTLTSIPTGHSPLSLFEPPLDYRIQDYFFLALFTRPEFKARIQTQVDLDINQPKVSDENKTMESREAAVLTECIDKLAYLSLCFVTIENNRLYLQKG